MFIQPNWLHRLRTEFNLTKSINQASFVLRFALKTLDILLRNASYLRHLVEHSQTVYSSIRVFGIVVCTIVYVVSEVYASFFLKSAVFTFMCRNVFHDYYLINLI